MATKPVVSNVKAESPSDSQVRVTWDCDVSVTRAIVTRSEWNGAGGAAWVGTAFMQVGAPTGNVRAFIDTTVKPGHSYTYRVAGVSSVQGEFVESNAVSTSAPAPVNVTATRRDNTTIVVKGWKPSGTIHVAQWYFERKADAGEWTPISNWGGSYDESRYYLDTSFPASATKLQYRMRLGASVGSSYVRYGAYTESNVVPALSAPAAPVNLSPNGTLDAATRQVKLSWVHVPTDSSSQQAAEVQTRPVGGTWSTVTVGSAQSYLWTPPLSGAYEWRVRTRGLSASWSPYSAVATLTIADAPTVVIQSPAGIMNTAVLDVHWATDQAQGLPQSGWEIELLDDEGAVLETANGSGAATSHTLKRHLQNREHLEIRVRVLAGGMWSDWISTFVEGSFREPIPPQLAVTWDEQQGCHTVTFDAEFTTAADVTNEGDGVFTFIWADLENGDEND